MFVNIDVMLISETHFTEKSYLKLPNYAVYHTNHPAGTAQGGTAIIIKNTIKHHQLNNYSQDFLQAASVSVEDSVGLITISAVYVPPKHTVKQEQLEDFYNTLGRLFITEGDYNAKHTDWGSRLITSRGCRVLKAMERNNLKHPSMGEPTYWPSGRNKLPDLVDFCVTKGIPQDFAVAKSCFDFLSDHSPVLITLTSHALNQEKQPSLSNRHTNWDDFRHLINQRLTLNITLKTEEDIDAVVNFFNDIVQWAGWNATPEHTDTLKTYDCPILIKQKSEEKRRLRRGWHRLRTPESKRLLNTATQELKQLLNNNRNDCIQTFLQGLTPTESSDYFLWKATKKIKQVKKPSPPLRTSQGTWARSNIANAHAFAEHLANFFNCIPSINLKRNKHIYNFSRPLPIRTTNQPSQKS
jgi:endonuclease/exonuclease/phosphatase family metal-dependent hydrolase